MTIVYLSLKYKWCFIKTILKVARSVYLKTSAFPYKNHHISICSRMLYAYFHLVTKNTEKIHVQGLGFNKHFYYFKGTLLSKTSTASVVINNLMTTGPVWCHCLDLHKEASSFTHHHFASSEQISTW